MVVPTMNPGQVRPTLAQGQCHSVRNAVRCDAVGHRADSHHSVMGRQSARSRRPSVVAHWCALARLAVLPPCVFAETAAALPLGSLWLGVSSECFGCAGCKIWYGNLRCTAHENVQLDTDAQNGYGPETITFNSVATGKYRFQVHKFSAGSPVAMKDSQGVVQERRSGLLVAPPHAHTRAPAQSYSTHTHSPLGPAHALCPTRSMRWLTVTSA